jgi:hypothetical protein
MISKVLCQTQGWRGKVEAAIDYDQVIDRIEAFAEILAVNQVKH